tara:strand:- start:945 stop:3560 length:2616 start_codon:yes stop_codon:yes gene_type:complete
MAKFNDKISTILNSQLPEFVVADHPKFGEFLKVYYQLLESAELSIDTIKGTDGILLQSETGQTNNLVLNSSRKDTARTLLDAGDKILLEESTYGKFVRSETVTGQTSKATAVVLVEDIVNNRLIITSQDKFVENEIIIGTISGAQANITNYKPNPVNNIVDLVHFRDPDNAIGHFLTNMRDEFLATLPENLATGISKRKLIKNIKSLYRAKGSVRGHEMFFRILFGENSETIYPREQMLKASDGQFDSLKVLRVIASVGDANQLVGRTITGQSSNTTAVVENTSQFQIGDQTVTQLILNEDSIQGTFTVGEEVRGTITDGDDYFIKANVTGIPGNKNITNDGSLNSTTDTISLTAGGEGALFQVEEIGPGSVTEMIVDNAGSGYNIGDSLSFTNTGTNGSNAAGFVKIVNGGFSGDSGTTGMSTGDRIVLEDETTSGDSYDGKVLVQEKFTGLQNITDFFLTNGGSQYTSLPTVVVTSSTGTNASIKVFGTDIGKVVKVKTVELGRSYENSPTPPILGFFNNGIVTGVSGTFLATNSITSSSGGSGIIVDLDVTRGLLKIKNVTGTFAIDDTLTSSTSGTCTLKKLDKATASVDVVSVSDTDGAFISERGKLSETTMRVQDSLYYQDYSYVIKVGRSIARWRDAFKKTMHTAGFYFTGQVDIESRVTVTAGGPVKGVTSGREEVPFLQIANTIFLTVFGRRLGTNSDGTSLRPNAHLRSETIDVSNAFEDPFSSNTRDLTATREDLEIDYLSRQRNKITDKTGTDHDVRTGYAYAGPRFSSINKHANTIFGTSSLGSKANTFQALNSLRIIGTRTDFDGQEVPYSIFNTLIGGSLKTNYAFPTQFSVSLELFSNTVTKFDGTNITFDDTTP